MLDRQGSTFHLFRFGLNGFRLCLDGFLFCLDLLRLFNLGRSRLAGRYKQAYGY
jgi:hypothetical protein